MTLTDRQIVILLIIGILAIGIGPNIWLGLKCLDEKNDATYADRATCFMKMRFPMTMCYESCRIDPNEPCLEIGSDSYPYISSCTKD